MRRDGRLHGNWSPFYSVTNHRESIWGRRGRGDEGLTQTLHPGSWQPSLFTMVMHKRKNATQSGRPGSVPVTLALDSSALGGWKCDLQIFFLMGDAAAGQHCSKAVRRLQSICLHFFHYILFFCIFSYQCLSSTSPLLYLGFLKRATVFLWALPRSVTSLEVFELKPTKVQSFQVRDDYLKEYSPLLRVVFSNRPFLF